MHIRAGAKGSVGFVIFKGNLFLEALDQRTSRVSEAKSLPPGCTNRVKLGSGGGFQLGLFYPQQQTFAARANTSVLCQSATSHSCRYNHPSGDPTLSQA